MNVSIVLMMSLYRSMGPSWVYGPHGRIATFAVPAYCGHGVAKKEMLVIEDFWRDRRFANNPMLKEHCIRF